MQKKLIALAIVAAFSTPAFAEVTVYGQVHASIDSNSGYADTAGTTANGLNITTNSSRVGFKGAEDLVGGLKGVFQIETGVNAGAKTQWGDARDTYIGVAGGFGTIIAGRLPLANQYANDANFFGAKVGDAANFTAGGFGGNGLLAVPSRVDRAAAYVSPSLGGVTVLAAYVPNTAQSLGLAQDNVAKAASYTLRASYDTNGIFAAANYVSIAGIAGTTPAAPAKDGKITIVSLAGGYDFGVAKVRAQLVQSGANAAAAGAEAKQTVLAVGGQFKLSDDSSISAEYVKAQSLKLAGTTVANSGASMMAVSFDQALSKNTTLYAAMAKVSNDTGAVFNATGYAHGGVGAPTAGKSPTTFSVGMIRNF